MKVSTKTRTLDLVGKILNGHYTVTRLIAHGGTSSIYEAEHAFTGRQVAIKVIAEDYARDDEIIALFKNEARVLSLLNDPRIVRYLDSFYDAPTESCCIVVNLVPGQTLAGWIAAGNMLTPEQAIPFARNVAEALNHIHKAGVVHCDISPENILLADGRTDRPVIIDFGIAKSDKGLSINDVDFFLGKFKNVAPEQLGLFEGKTDLRSDIYSFGLTLAAALGGKSLHMGLSAESARHARMRIPDLDHIPPQFKSLLKAMLEPDPQNRPSNMEQTLSLIEYSDQVAANKTVPVVPRRPVPSRRPAATSAKRAAAVVATAQKSVKKKDFSQVFPPIAPQEVLKAAPKEKGFASGINLKAPPSIRENIGAYTIYGVGVAVIAAALTWLVILPFVPDQVDQSTSAPVLNPVFTRDITSVK